MSIIKNPEHPREVHSELFLEPLDMSADVLKKRLVDVSTIESVVAA